MSVPMRVNLLLHSIGKSGGVQVVMEHARRLERAGHDVCVYYPTIPYPEYFTNTPAWKRPFSRMRTAWREIRGAHAVGRDVVTGVRVRRIPFVSNLFVRDADVIVATAWPTAYDVAALSKRKGAKAYFIQGHETWDGSPERVSGSYRLQMRLIAVSDWLAEIVRKESGGRQVDIVPNGVDEKWRPPAEPERHERPSILMMYHESTIKGSQCGLRVLRRIRKSFPDALIRIFGLAAWVPEGGMQYTQNPSPDELLRLYQQSTVYLNPSFSEGWGLTTVEAMASGCAVVATRVGCVPELESERALLAASPGDEDQLYQHVVSLIADSGLRAEIVHNGLRSVRRFGWPQSASLFEGALLSTLNAGRLT